MRDQKIAQRQTLIRTRNKLREHKTKTKNLKYERKLSIEYKLGRMNVNCIFLKVKLKSLIYVIWTEYDKNKTKNKTKNLIFFFIFFIYIFL